MQRIIVKIEGPALDDVDEIELPHLPREGEPIETRYGTCLIVRSELFDDNDTYSGQITCRLG